MVRFALMRSPMALFIEGVGCWTLSTPTPPSLNPTVPAPAPTLKPALTQADLGMGESHQRYQINPCAQISGNPSVSDFIFTCPSDQTCAIQPAANNWGCCKEVPVPGCSELYCPNYLSCIDSASLTACNSDCMRDTGVLKCTNSTKPFCATARALITDSTVSFPMVSQFACAESQYTMTFTVFAEDIYETAPCAPPWITNPASLAAWSSTAASQVSFDLIENFADPFDQVVARANVSASTASPLTTTGGTTAISPPPTVSIPSTPAASTTTSLGTKSLSLCRGILHISSLLTVGNFLS